jgi:uncharacterized phage protein (TIGR02220 family)
MSISVMTTVWEASKLGGTELLLLLGIADFANQDGVAYPSVATLAKKIRMSERNTHYLLKKLVDSGELEVKRNAGPRGCNLFRVKTLHHAASAPVQSIAGGGATGSAKGVQPTAPEPSLNRQEPLSKAAAEVLTHLNAKTGRNYQLVQANVSLVAARLKEGATPDECRRVIDSKVAEWRDSEKMSKCLRPATLFNATKFAQYVGELANQTSETGVERWE